MKRIVIVGGGSAGWLTAGVLAGHFKSEGERSLQVTLIESPDIATVGVGEGTWPSMRTTLQRMGVSETDFIRECDVSLKQGTRFDSWVTSAHDHYYHPFSLPQGFGDVNLVHYWQQVRDKISFADAVGQQSRVCDQGLAPKTITTPEYAFNLNYGYHLDAGKFADFLKRHCVDTLGVQHVQDHVTGVTTRPNGDIDHLNTQETGHLHGDLFVDCTGFAALLIGQHYEVPLHSVKDMLFNDSALAVQVPYRNTDDPIASHTLSTAQSAGWIWNISLPTRRGVGYVYSSDFISDDNAQRELRDYLDVIVGRREAEKLDVRKIAMNPGYRTEFWRNNCVAVGLSAGFVEPLEASALVLVEYSAKMLAEQLPVNRDMMTLTAKRFNQKFTHHWHRIIDFLKLHYLLNRREDNGYWEANRQVGSVSERLRESLLIWQHQAPWLHDAPHFDELFSSASFQYVLYGMGFATHRTQPEIRHEDTAIDRANSLFADNANRTSQLLQSLPTNRQLVNKVHEFGFQKI